MSYKPTADSTDNYRAKSATKGYNSRIFLIIKAIISGTTWLSVGGRRETFIRDKLWIFILAIVGSAVGLTVLVGMLYLLYTRILVLGINLGNPQLVIFYSGLLSWLLLFFLGLPIVLSVLYYSSDTEILVSLPVMTFDIVAAKIAVVFLYTLPINLVIFLPALLVYMPVEGASFGMRCAQVFSAVFVVPLLPLALGTFIVFLISRVVNLSRYKTVLELIGMAASLFAILAIQGFLSKALSGSTGTTFSSLNGLPDIYGSISKYIPPLYWLAEGFTSYGYFKLLYFIGISLILMFAVLELVCLTYLTDFSRRSESGKRRVGNTSARGKLSLLIPRARNPTFSLVVKEWKILVSNSTFIFEAVGEMLILPLVLVVFKFISPGNVIGMINLFISQSKISGLLVFATLSLIMSLNGVASTSISREGKSFSLSLYLPITGKQAVISKWLFQLFLFYPAYIVDVVLIYSLFRIPPIELLYILPGGFSLITMVFVINIYFDLRRPILNWTHPQQAMKQNVNVLAGGAFNILVLAVFGLAGYVLLMFGVSALSTGLILFGAISVVAVSLLRVISVFADRRYLFELEY